MKAKPLTGWVLTLLPLLADPAAALGQCAAGAGKIFPSLEAGQRKWLDCNGQHVESYTTPAQARVFPFRMSALSTQYTGNFDRTLAKVDVVWLADNITITQPLRSFGGDIILFADAVTIEAPVDSRPYFEHQVDHFAPTVDYKVGKAVKTSEWVAENSNYVDAFRDYYEHCTECYPGETRIPELPSGIGAPTPVPATGVTDDIQGGDAPDSTLITEHVRSGNIYVFANRLKVVPALHKSLAPYRAECSSNIFSWPQRVMDSVRHFFGGTDFAGRAAFDASGLSGGRGGTGSASNAPDTVHPGAIPALYHKGGQSGRGGPGGDAGNIYIALVNATDDNVRALKDQLQFQVSIAGGSPGSNLVYKTPSTLPPGQVTPSRCSFTRLAEWPQAAKGQEGQFAIERRSGAEALATLATLLEGKSLRVDYDVAAQMQLMKSDRSVTSLLPKDALTEYLTTQLVQTQARYLAALKRAFIAQQPDQPYYLPSILEGLSVDALKDAPLDTDQRSRITELSSFRNAAGLVSYLQRTGGLFNVYSQDALDRMNAGELKVLVAFGNLTLTEIKDELGELNRNFFQFVADNKMQELLSRIQALKDKIAAAQAEASKADNNKPGLAKVIDALAKLGEAANKVAEAIGKKDYQGAANSVPELVDRIKAVFDLQQQTSPSTLPGLYASLADIQRQYDDFASYVVTTKETYLSNEQGDSARMLKARAAFAGELGNETGQFHDLMRAAIISFVTSGQSQYEKDQLATNLDGIAEYLTAYPNRNPTVHIRKLTSECTVESRDCMTFGLQQAIYCQRFAGAIRALPLYDQPGPRPVPLFGLPPESLRTTAPGAAFNCSALAR